MTPIHDDTAVEIQTRFRELGRIRTGALVAMGKSTKTRPTKLDNFRLTSADEELIKKAAALYGGEVTPWLAPSGDQFQVEITTASIPIILPPNEQLDQWMEMWSGGGCQRRCDGRTETINQVDCECPSDRNERQEMASKGKACQPTTRLRVMLPEIPGLGIWRLETRSWNAAAELKGVHDLLQHATARGLGIRCALRLDPRISKSDGKTHKFGVPVIDLMETLDDLITGQLEEAPQIELDGHGPRGTQRVSTGQPIEMRTVETLALDVPTEELQGENEQLTRKVFTQLFPNDITYDDRIVTVAELQSRFIKEQLPELYEVPLGKWSDGDWSDVLEAADAMLSGAGE